MSAIAGDYAARGAVRTGRAAGNVVQCGLKRGYRGRHGVVETDPSNLIRLIPA
jgi:hypothetical protein